MAYLVNSRHEIDAGDAYLEDGSLLFKVGTEIVAIYAPGHWCDFTYQDNNGGLSKARRGHNNFDVGANFPKNVTADRFEVIDGQLVFRTGTLMVHGFAAGQWSSARYSAMSRDKEAA